jgi:hypothetical protein
MASDNKNTVTVGLTKWGEKAPRSSNNNRDDLPKIPYARYKEGNNIFRMVLGPAKYYQARVKLPKSRNKLGDKERTAYPTYAECPIKNTLGIEPRPRYLALAISRSSGELEIVDFNSLVEETIANNLNSRNEGKPAEKHVTASDFDINIRFNPKSKTPAGYYTAIILDKEPLTDEDRKIVDSVGLDVMEKILNQQCICPKPETVLKRLMDKGYEPGMVFEKKEKETKAAALEEAEDDDYNFSRDEAAAG